MHKSFHVSDLRAYQKCPKLFLNQRETEKTEFFSFIQMQMSMKDALIAKLNLTDFGIGYRGMDMHESFELLNKHDWNLNLRFEYLNLRVKTLALHKVNDGYDLYFSSISNYPRIEDKSYYATVTWVLRNLGLKLNSIQVLYLNAEYTRREELDVEACFLLSSSFKKQSGFEQGDILEHCEKAPSNLESALIQMTALEDIGQYDMTKEECPIGRRCNFFQTCFPNEETKYEISQQLIDRGLNSLESDPPLSRSDYAQVQAHLNHGRFVDQVALSNWCSNFDKNVMSFVDFEWDTYGIPPYEKMKVFDVLPFQYSIHVLEDGKLSHKDFLGDQDCREAFIESFIKDLPKEGPIFAYNAFGAEVLRLKSLAQQFPKYQVEIESIVERFVDLAQLFVGGAIYDEKMEGLFSLKQLLKVIDPNLSYESLAISHGIEAVKHYRTLQDEENDETKRQALLSYCQMDTYAMVKVFEWIKSLKEERYA